MFSLKQLSLIITVTCVLIGGFFIFKKRSVQNAAGIFTIGILQTASHPALDAARSGFMEELTHLMGKKITFIINNAQGLIATAHTIAQRFHADPNIRGVFAIATPATQAIASIEKEKPLFIAAVTDPYALGIMNTNNNITGSQDMINVPATVDMLHTLLPQAQKIGLLYNSGESNSVILVTKMKEELIRVGLQPIDVAVTNEADLIPALQTAMRHIDALLAPTDNTVASTIQLISTLALEHKKPLIVSDNLLVKQGALASRGVDYKESGKQAARIAHKVLVEGKKPSELPIARQTESNIIINAPIAAKLGVIIPDTIKKDVILIH